MELSEVMEISQDAIAGGLEKAANIIDEIDLNTPEELPPCFGCGSLADTEIKITDQCGEGTGYICKIFCTKCHKSVSVFSYKRRDAVVRARSFWCRRILDLV